MLAAFAEYFSANLSREVKKGLTERYAAGYLPSIIPYGARLDGTGKALEVNPDTAEALALLLELVATESYIGAARALNERGIPARRGGTWHGSSVRVVVECAGWLASQPGPWPDRYRTAATRIGKAPVRTGRMTRMLTGLLRCAHCGRTIGYQPRGDFPPSLKCQRTDGTPPCTGPGKHLAPHYEAQVLAWVAALPDEGYVAELAARQAEAGDPSLALAEALRAEGDRLSIAWVKGDLSRATYDALSADLAARKRALPAPALSLQLRLAELLQLRDGFPALPAEAQNTVLRGLCERIAIDGGKALVVPRGELVGLL